jgi:hypothetical protein
VGRGERPIKLGNSSYSPKCLLGQRCGMLYRGRATNWTRGCHNLPNPDELRMLYNSNTSEARGAKVTRQEGNNPDRQLRSPNLC